MSWVWIYNTSLFFKPWKWTNKPECYNALGQKGLQGTNTLAYLAHLQITMKIKCFEYDS